MLTSLATRHPEALVSIISTFRVAHLSDPHLTTLAGAPWSAFLNKRLLGYLSWRRRQRFDHDPRVLARLVRDLRTREFDHIAVTGDLTHVGLPQECRAAADWLAELGEPAGVTLVPGNHDRYVAAPWSSTVGLWADYLAGDASESERESERKEVSFPTLRERAGVAVIGLDSGIPSAPLFATGCTSESQRAGLADLLRNARSRGLFRMVLIHHSPLPDGHRWRKRLTDAQAVMAVLREAGAELVVHGHGHRRRVDVVPTADGQMVVVAAPSASLNTPGQGGYNGYAIAVEEGQFSLEVTEYAAGVDSVQIHERSEFTFQRR